MTLETLSPNEFLNFIIYDTISATPYSNSHGALLETSLKPEILSSTSVRAQQRRLKETQVKEWKQNLGAQGIKRKRRRKPRVCKNKQEAETQRMTHIAVERNRRKQMNEHLAVLRSIMPESYVQRGDQASIVGGAIEFVKELEHLLQSLEAQKLQLLNGMRGFNTEEDTINKLLSPPPFAQFFVHPQCTWSQMPNKYASKAKASIADIEVTLIETHANLRILSRRRSTSQLFKLVTGFQSLCLTILHINVTTMDLLVLYSISAKLEEECQLTSVDDIAAAVHHMLRIIEEEAAQNAPLV